MNERMAELFGQAGISDSINEEFEIEYLAELIVKECANMAECFHRNQYDFTGDLELHEFIRKHFGVKA